MQNHMERVINGNVIVGFDVFPQLRKLGLNKIRYMDLSSLGKIELSYSSTYFDAGEIMKFAVGLLCFLSIVLTKLAKLNFNEDVKFSTYYHRVPVTPVFKHGHMICRR